MKKKLISIIQRKLKQNSSALVEHYFSKKSPSKTDYYHVTSFTGRPEQRIKRIYGVIDNYIRNTAAKVFKVGRGKNLRRSEAES